MSLINKTITRINSSLYQIVKYSSITANEPSKAFVFKSNFTHEEQSKILNILNQSNSDQLSQFNVSQIRIKNLESWRSKKGPFKSLSDVLEVEGLGEKVLEKICERIITENSDVTKTFVKSKSTTNKRVKQILNPPLLGNMINGIQSAVGIHLGPTGISWAKLSRQNNTLNNWNYQNFTTLPQKLMPNETFDLAINILSKIPTGDSYIFEANSNMSPQAQTQSVSVSSYTQQLELTSMLLALINTSKKHNLSLLDANSDGEPKTNVENRVYHLRSKIPARLFRTLVGTERVSAITTIAEIVDFTGETNFSLPCTPINLDQQIRVAYNSQPSANKELLGQALMLIISFMDLCVYKNANSLAAITPGRNKQN